LANLLNSLGETLELKFTNRYRLDISAYQGCRGYKKLAKIYGKGFGCSNIGELNCKETSYVAY